MFKSYEINALKICAVSYPSYKGDIAVWTPLAKMKERGFGLIIGRRFPNSLRLLICRIDVTALAAVLFVLVTALAVRPVADLANEVGVDLPGTNHAIAIADATHENSLLIAVTRDDRIFLGRDNLKPESLSNAIRDRLSYGAERKVYIRADKRAQFGTVKKTLDAVRTTGIEQVVFLVDGPVRRQ